MMNNISPKEMNNNGWGVNPMGIGMNEWIGYKFNGNGNESDGNGNKSNRN